MSAELSWISKPHPDDARLCISDAIYRNALIHDSEAILCLRATLGEIKGYPKATACDSIVYTQRHIESQQFRPFRFEPGLPEAFFTSFGRNVFRSREEELRGGGAPELERSSDEAAPADGSARNDAPPDRGEANQPTSSEPSQERSLSPWSIGSTFYTITNSLGVQKRKYSISVSTQMNTRFYGLGDKQKVFLKHTQMEALLGASNPIPDYRFTVDRFAPCPETHGNIYEIEERRFPVREDGMELWVVFRTSTSLGSKTRTVEVTASNETVQKVLEESKKILASELEFDSTLTWAVAGLFLRVLFTLKCLY